MARFFNGSNNNNTQPVNNFAESSPTAPAVDGGMFTDSSSMGMGPGNDFNSGFDATMDVQNGFDVADNMGMGNTFADSEATGPVVSNGIEGFTPVVGWLVCIDGPAKGNDYRIRAGYNYIGRGENMDICIHGDNTIGRERHAMIAYDEQENLFFFGPADGKSIVRRNDKMVMVPVQLNDYDVLRIGSTKLVFVPLCGERFTWNA